MSEEQDKKNIKLNRYKKLNKLGEGSYGIVYKALDSQDNKIVAIKKYKLQNDNDGIPYNSLREISILKKINHKNIVKVYDVIYRPFENKLKIIMEFIEDDLSMFLKKNEASLNIFTAKSIIYQILNGLKLLHSKRIIHRDIKPSNILIDKDGVIKIADFGLSRNVQVERDQELTLEISTLYYKAPEILLGDKNYKFYVDIWAVGIIFYELVEHKIMFEGDSEFGQIIQIFKFFGKPNEFSYHGVSSLLYWSSSLPNFSQDLDSKFNYLLWDNDSLSLLLSLLVINPNHRLSAVQALSNQYFLDLDIINLN